MVDPVGGNVEFATNGSTVGGYLAAASEGAGLGVVVIHQWWGLVPQIRDVCDRLAVEGFTALAPDLYHGHTDPPGKPDLVVEAQMSLDLEPAVSVMAGAAEYLAGHEAVRGNGLGAIGFCLGGGLALVLATVRPDLVKAVVPFYGIMPRDREPDWSRLEAAVEGHYAEEDETAGPEVASDLEQRLTDLGKEVRMFLYPGTHRAFFDDTRPDVHDPDAARQAWIRTLEFLRAKLG